jgi:hypothetical protein
VGRAPSPAAVDLVFDVVLKLTLAHVGRTLLSAAVEFEVDVDVEFNVDVV